MDEVQIQQIVDELLSSLEPLETQSSALLQFLKAKGLATDEDLAPFLDQAANTASVRWLAVKVRTAALISNAMKSAGQPTEPIATNNPLIAAKPVAEMKPQKEQENVEQGEEQGKKEQGKKEQEKKDEKPAQESEKKNMAQKQQTETAAPPEQRAEETPKPDQSIPESDEAPKESRPTNADAPEAPSKHDTREAA